MPKKDAFYFPHDYNAASDVKCLFLRQQLGMEGYGIFWFLVEQLANSGGKLPLQIIPVLAMQMQVPEVKVTAVIKQFGLFEVENDEIFFSQRLCSHLEIRKELSDFGKIGAEARWGKNRGAIMGANDVANGDANAKERKGKENKGKESIRDFGDIEKPKKGSKAIKFSDDGEYAIFENGYRQKIGRLQKKEIEDGFTKASHIILDSIY